MAPARIVNGTRTDRGAGNKLVRRMAIASSNTRSRWPLIVDVLIIICLAILVVPSSDDVPGDTMRITGTVVDSETNEPVSNAHVILSGKGRLSTRTDAEGSYNFLIGDEMIGYYDIIRIDVRAAGYSRAQASANVGKAGSSYRIDHIKMQYRSLRFPIPDRLKNCPPIPESPEPTWPYESPAVRTNRLPGMPDRCFRRAPDRNGGEWILFGFGITTPILISYRNPDGTMERYCPTGASSHSPFTLTTEADTAVVTYGITRDGEDVKGCFRVTLSEMRKDSDGDSLIDLFESFYGLDPFKVDTDLDGIDDLNDPLPTVEFRPVESDTAAVLLMCFEDAYYIDMFSTRYLKYVSDALPESVGCWLLDQARRQPGYDPRYLHKQGQLDRILVTMTASELKYLYPFLKEISLKSIHDFGKGGADIFTFPYLESLAAATDDNIEKIRRDIMKSHFTYLIEPVCLRGDQPGFGVHPESRSRTYIPAERLSAEFRSPRAFQENLGIQIINMDSTAALIQFDCSVAGEDWLFVKRDGRWVKVYRRMNWIS